MAVVAGGGGATAHAVTTARSVPRTDAHGDERGDGGRGQPSAAVSSTAADSAGHFRSGPAGELPERRESSAGPCRGTPARRRRALRAGRLARPADQRGVNREPAAPFGRRNGGAAPSRGDFAFADCADCSALA